jgi:hypothetical protein
LTLAHKYTIVHLGISDKKWQNFTQINSAHTDAAHQQGLVSQTKLKENETNVTRQVIHNTYPYILFHHKLIGKQKSLGLAKYSALIIYRNAYK